ncbi:unnamed protein product [Macrosiphum euphorbiae]|uniref:Uncharacterized protein n=1 Tax=Macrosiphum euphorbiae TaxID=13131 RepID=A0AAV0VJZ0_9HEMI|nr:unnamed protein product [Macrosiphum euphorbiae]
MLSTAFESAGHKSLHSPNNNIDNKIALSNENIKYVDQYNDLKTLILDHQNILKKYDEFLSIFHPTMLLQVFVVSCSIIVFWFILLTSFMEDDFTQYMAFRSIESIFGIPFCTSQMYMSCFVFTTLNIKKDAISFALYSSNWTEMKMKYKKLILLTMRMNDAHQKKFHYTMTRTINIEIFYQTMRVCYTIVNVMLNCKK